MEQPESGKLSSPRIFDLPQFRDRTRIFQDRQEAGQVLAALLPSWFLQRKPILLAISAAGYTLATILAQRYKLDVDFTPVQNVALPWDDNVDYAAVAFDGTVYLDRELLERNRLGQREVDKGVERAFKMMQRELDLVNFVSLHTLRNRNILLVDESITAVAVVAAATKALKAYCTEKPSLAVTTAYNRALVRVTPSLGYVFCTNVRSGFSFSADDAYKPSVASDTLHTELFHLPPRP